MPNQDQIRRWNGPSGDAWTDRQPVLDAMFQPVEDLLVAAVSARHASRVLDVGCGTGSTTIAIAQEIAREIRAPGCCVGIDVSAPMIEMARGRAAHAGVDARFVCADAQMHAFEAAGFDMIVSRFGVMFFDDPCRAFANLRAAAIDGADLCAIAWRSAAENPFMTTAERAAAAWLPASPPQPPEAPGQFAFADRTHVTAVLRDSGWSEVRIEPIDVACALPEAELRGYIARLGPVGAALQDLPEAERARRIDALREAFASFVHGDEVRYTAACWRITARAGSMVQAHDGG